MSLNNNGLSARSLAELALIVSRVSRFNSQDVDALPPHVVQALWRNSRSLEQRWINDLQGWSLAGTLDVEPLAELMPRILTCDMVVRVWSTVIVSSEREQSRGDLMKLASSAVNSFARVRHGILLRLLAVPSIYSFRVAQLDRLRRRSERWNDVLIGCTRSPTRFYDFAFNSDRARDFYEEGTDATPATGPNVAEHFVSAGISLNFIRHLPDTPLDEPEISTLIASILSSFPKQAFDLDGTLRTQLEWRLGNSCQKEERRGTPENLSFFCPDDVSN